MKTNTTPILIATAFGGLLAGAITGATLSSVKAVKKVKDKKITAKQASKEVLQESTSLGIATSVGVTTTALLGITGVLSIASVALVTASTKYALDNVLSEKNSNEAKEITPLEVKEA